MRFILTLLTLMSSLLFGSINTITQAKITNQELQLFFNKPLHLDAIKGFKLSRPTRVVYDFTNTKLLKKNIGLNLGEGITISQHTRNKVRVTINTSNAKKASRSAYISPSKTLHIPLPRNFKSLERDDAYTDSRFTEEREPINTNNRHDVIVIDAGHGGHDSGAIAQGRYEKQIALKISQKVANELRKKGYSAYLTRNSDRFLKLTERTKIADQKQAKVFISIHANSVPKSKQHIAHGIETYYLQKTRDERSQKIAEIENSAVLQGADRITKHVIIDSVLNGPKIVESQKLAIDVQRRILHNVKSRYTNVKNGGVRPAPFYVLVGASRPSILIEVGYISHPVEGQRISQSDYQSSLAKGIAEGVESYLINRKREIDL